MRIARSACGIDRIAPVHVARRLPRHRQRHRRPARGARRWPTPGDVVILTKADPRESNTGYAQGGIAAALGADDSPELHARDTIAAGDGLCVPEAVRRARARRAALRARADRVGRGVRSRRRRRSRRSAARPRTACAACCTRATRPAARSAACSGARVSADPRITRASTTRWRLALVMRDGRCVGRDVRRPRRRAGHGRRAARRCWRPAAPGRCSARRPTRRSPPATASRWPFEAGARVADLEFVQFHPTVLNVDGRAAVPAVRGAARRRRAADQRGRRARSCTRYEPAGDLASRDLVSRAIVREVAAHRRAGLPDDGASRSRVRPAPVPDDRARRVAQAGLDLARDRIPVSPAAHYVMGGVETDLDGRTSIAGLFAAGEVACTGVHGANRLASNSLLEGLVFGARAADAMTARAARPASLGAERRSG